MRVTQRSVVYFQQYSKITLVLGLSLMCSFLSTMAHAASAGFFAKGSKQFAIYVGSGSAFNNNYTVIGGSAAYYFADGFDVGLSAEVWSGASPGIQKISPSLQYVFYQPSVVKPYVGIFYRRTYIDNLPDLNSTGARPHSRPVASSAGRVDAEEISKTVYPKTRDHQESSTPAGVWPAAA